MRIQSCVLLLFALAGCATDSAAVEHRVRSAAVFYSSRGREIVLPFRSSKLLPSYHLYKDEFLALEVLAVHLDGHAISPRRIRYVEEAQEGSFAPVADYHIYLRGSHPTLSTEDRFALVCYAGGRVADVYEIPKQSRILTIDYRIRLANGGTLRRMQLIATNLHYRDWHVESIGQGVDRRFEARGCDLQCASAEIKKLRGEFVTDRAE